MAKVWLFGRKTLSLHQKTERQRAIARLTITVPAVHTIRTAGGSFHEPAKSKIANDFGLCIHSDLASWLEAIAYLRNIVAHHSRLWSRNMVKRPSEQLNPHNTWLSHQLSDIEAKRPFYIITAMLYLCDAVNPGRDMQELLAVWEHLQRIA